MGYVPFLGRSVRGIREALPDSRSNREQSPSRTSRLEMDGGMKAAGLSYQAAELAYVDWWGKARNRTSMRVSSRDWPPRRPRSESGKAKCLDLNQVPDHPAYFPHRAPWGLHQGRGFIVPRKETITVVDQGASPSPLPGVHTYRWPLPEPQTEDVSATKPLSWPPKQVIGRVFGGDGWTRTITSVLVCSRGWPPRRPRCESGNCITELRSAALPVELHPQMKRTEAGGLRPLWSSSCHRALVARCRAGGTIRRFSDRIRKDRHWAGLIHSRTAQRRVSFGLLTRWREVGPLGPKMTQAALGRPVERVFSVVLPRGSSHLGSARS